MRIPLRTLVAAIAAGAVLVSPAATMYKLIGKDGRVTYSEEEPKNFDGKVIRMDIDPNANRSEAPPSVRDTVREPGRIARSRRSARSSTRHAMRCATRRTIPRRPRSSASAPSRGSRARSRRPNTKRSSRSWRTT